MSHPDPSHYPGPPGGADPWGEPPTFDRPPSGYDAPSPGYHTPGADYSTPPGDYNLPAGGYTTPSAGYGTPTGGYGAPPPGGYPPQYSPGGGYGSPPPSQPQTTNGFAIAALICGIVAPCGAGLFALIFGIIGLSQIGKRRQKGRGLAITGLILTGVWFIGGLIAVIIALMTSDADPAGEGGSGTGSQNQADDQSGSGDQDDTSDTTDTDDSDDVGGPISVIALEPGDCIEELETGHVGFTLPGVPCSQPHQGEVYSVFDVTFDGSWPGEPPILEEAQTGCLRDLEENFPEIYDDSQVDIFYLHPSEATWRTGDREVVCITYYLDGNRTGSIFD